LQEAHRLDCEAWSSLQFIGGDASPSPLIADAIHGRRELLEVQCRHCNHTDTIDLTLAIWPRANQIHTAACWNMARSAGQILSGYDRDLIQRRRLPHRHNERVRHVDQSLGLELHRGFQTDPMHVCSRKFVTRTEESTLGAAIVDDQDATSYENSFIPLGCSYLPCSLRRCPHRSSPYDAADRPVAPGRGPFLVPLKFRQFRHYPRHRRERPLLCVRRHDSEKVLRLRPFRASPPSPRSCQASMAISQRTSRRPVEKNRGRCGQVQPLKFKHHKAVAPRRFCSPPYVWSAYRQFGRARRLPANRFSPFRITYRRRDGGK
jgi:hypothetical protein